MKRIVCQACAPHWKPINPVDQARGFKVSFVYGLAKKPKNLSTKETRITEKEITVVEKELLTLKCDDCGINLPDGTPIVAVTYSCDYKDFVSSWEKEYLQDKYEG